jgi:integrase
MKKAPRKEDSTWSKVGPCLYRYVPSGIYYALIKSSGKQIRSSLETNDLPTARRKLVDKRRDLELIDPELSRRTLDTHAERFLETVTGSESTVYNVKHAVKRLLADWPAKASRILTKIHKGDCEQWLATYGDLSASTVNTYIATASKFFGLAVGDNVIPRSPMEDITYRRRKKLTRLTPTREQFDSMVADLREQAANGHGAEDTADYIALAGLLGLGQAELSGIQRQHIDFVKGTIQVFRNKTSQAFTIPLYPQARVIVERRLKAMPADPQARLLPFENCKKALDGVCKRLKLPHFEHRALRRFFITQALRKGVDVPTVALWQGHQDGGALILRTYADEVRLDHSLRMALLMNTDTPSNAISVVV